MLKMARFFLWKLNGDAIYALNALQQKNYANNLKV
jgi:hypothetical protein